MYVVGRSRTGGGVEVEEGQGEGGATDGMTKQMKMHEGN